MYNFEAIVELEEIKNESGKREKSSLVCHHVVSASHGRSRGHQVSFLKPPWAMLAEPGGVSEFQASRAVGAAELVFHHPAKGI
jgi:hypothetical protein